MVKQSQLTGMRGVYLVAAELSRHGFIASPTSRSTKGADILVTDQRCLHSFSVQVKTNASTFSYWLLNAEAKEMVSPTHIYAFVNLLQKRKVEETEFFIVPSEFVAKNIFYEESKTGSKWWSISRDSIASYRDNWSLFSTEEATGAAK
jgi:hypothetical protein